MMTGIRNELRLFLSFFVNGVETTSRSLKCEVTARRTVTVVVERLRHKSPCLAAPLSREKNKEHINQTKKEYVINNKVKTLEYFKEYYEKNKDEHLEKKRQNYICGCGAVLSLQAKSRHEKTNKHIENI